MNSFFQATVRFFSTQWEDLLWPSALFLGVLLIGLALRSFVFSRLKVWASKTESKLDDPLVESMRSPALLWIIILGIYVATDLSKLPPQVIRWSSRALIVLWIVSLTIVLSRFAGQFVQVYSGRGAPAGTLLQKLAAFMVAVMGGLVLLNEFGISITPMLTALGVGGIAVALALQDTLSNLFAGFYVSMGRQVRLGDFVQLESGQKGYVTDIGWRSTTLREGLGNLIVIPNNKMAQSIVTNYHLPQRRMVLTIPVSVSYTNDPEHVERVLLDIVRQAAGDVPGLLADPGPSALLMPGFGANSLDFTLICHVADFEAQGQVQHHLRKRIFRRFREEGIAIPMPARIVEYRDSPPMPPRAPQ